MAKPSILVVEDEFIVAQDLAASLAELGYHVCAIVDSGAEAIEKTGRLAPDLILMDIVLKGGMDGIQAAATVHQLYHTPVIFLTAHSDQMLLQRARIAEPFGYLLKPFTQKELHSAIEVGLYKARMENRLRESEKRYRQTVDMLPTGICEIDRDYRITFANQAALTILDLPLQASEGFDLRNRFKSRGREVSGGCLEQAVLGLESAPVESRLLKTDGTEIDVIVSCATIYQGASIIGVRLSLTDVTMINQLHVELERARRLETVGKLAGSMAHELNNALATIVTGLDLLEIEAPRSLKGKKYLASMKNAVERMSRIVERLLEQA